MMRNSFLLAVQLLKKDFLFVVLIIFLNLILNYMTKMMESSSVYSTSELIILYQFLIGLLQAWTLISISVRIQKYVQTNRLEPFLSSFKNGFLATPGTILYALIYGVLVAIGTILFVIPGFYLGVVFFYAPFLAMFDIEGEDTILNESRKLAKGNFINTFLFLLLCIVSELANYGVFYLWEKNIFDIMIIWVIFILTSFLSVAIQSWFCQYFFLLLKRRS